MRILVLIKQILDPRGIQVRRDKEKVFINSEDYIIGRDGKAALEAALRIKDGSDAEVIALTVGKPRADGALREALAMGCDAAYLLTDKAFDKADIAVTVRALAAAVGKLGGVDLIVAGTRSRDTGGGQIGPRLAEVLGYAQVTQAYALAVDDGRLRATRRWSTPSGYAAVETPLPAVVTVAAEAFPPRYPPGARIMSAYQEWQVTTWDAAALELDEEALTPIITLRGETFPPPLPVGETYRGEPGSVAGEVVMTLKLQKAIG